jgi:uridylate kinase
MDVVVISLGGSLIIPDKINIEFLDKFKKELQKNYNKTRFVIVTGGGSIARKYIEVLKKEGKNDKEISLSGIRATRMNALFLMQFFGKEANDNLPKDMHEVKNNLHKNKVVICGALRYANDETSDGTAAKLARYLNCDFINITNVKGLYDSDPNKYKDSKFISKISWKEFQKITDGIRFSAGQHFVLDQEAARIIHRYRIETYIIGDNLKNISKIINGKTFIGTMIKG